MARYIDADALFKRTTTKFDDCEEFIELIETQPTADVVEVVRCKDCLHRSKGKYNHLGELKYFCAKVEKYVPDDGFCYMGERG